MPAKTIATWTALGWSALALASLGCVTSGTYEELQQQHQALMQERDALQQDAERMTREIGMLESERDALAGTLASTQREVEALTLTHDQLVGELRSEIESGQVVIQKLVDGVRLGVSDELLFPSGGATLNDAGRALVTRVAGQLQNEASLVFVEGHTDDVPIGAGLRGRYPTNWELAAARASLVVRVLSEGGVDPTRLRAVSRGPFAPLVPNDSAENRAKNRRTEIILRQVPRS